MNTQIIEDLGNESENNFPEISEAGKHSPKRKKSGRRTKSEKHLPEDKLSDKKSAKIVRFEKKEKKRSKKRISI